MSETEIETMNKFLVGVKDEDIVILNPPKDGRLSQDDAMLLAAWIVALTFDREKFNAVLRAVEGP